MKTILMLLALAFTFTSCSEDSEPKKAEQKTDPAMQQFYTAFLQYADSYDVEITKTVVLQFGECDCQKDGVWYVATTADNEFLEFYIYHTLGHALLNKVESEGISVMNINLGGSVWVDKKAQLMEDLFTL
jgi:hypothetical protein